MRAFYSLCLALVLAAASVAQDFDAARALVPAGEPFTWLPGMPEAMQDTRIGVTTVAPSGPAVRWLYPAGPAARWSLVDEGAPGPRRKVLEVRDRIDLDAARSLSVELCAVLRSGAGALELTIDFANGLPGSREVVADLWVSASSPGALFWPLHARWQGVVPGGASDHWRLPQRDLCRGGRSSASFVLWWPALQSTPPTLDDVPAIRAPWLVPDPPGASVPAWRQHAQVELARNAYGVWEAPRWPTGRADITPGSGGDNERIGWFDGGIREAMLDPRVRVWLLEAVRWVEQRRPVWFDSPPRDGSAFLFGQQGFGLHRFSLVTWGHVHDGSTWDPPMGDRHGWGAWNLEHLVSLLPMVARMTGDPWARRRAVDLGWVAANILSPAGIRNSQYPGETGGYSGGNVETESPRGWLRPLRTVAEAELVAREAGWLEEADALRAVVLHRMGRVLARCQPLRWGITPRIDSQVRGTEPIVNVWQVGLAAWLELWRRTLPDPDRDGAPLLLLREMQQLLLDSAHIVGGELVLAKQILASDRTVGARYRNGLEGWQYALARVPDLPGIDQNKRAAVVAAIERLDPRVASGASEWSCGAYPPVGTR